ncbi:ubiquitin-conjugating enzyme E2 Q1-like isoform X1 [Ostrea edulis]|uniref:ubiquitin-conjugating enzyme E2 Q1-like isoform X1 n=1 Tax=Ostrea edulis TaxID=37623 RepID=UPI0024AF2032|nr:ubiquitin-conjugating enzyme E2 Q1-like isoform X1 [Ostrea edulis]
MDFRQQYESAQEWADGEKDFSVGSEDEEERNFRLTILNTDLVFTITVPKEDDRDWMVWSECEKVLPYLQDIQEFLSSSKKRTITEILNKVKVACQKLLPSSGEDENESDDDEFDDDYYNQDDDEMEEDAPAQSREARVDEEDDEEEANFFGSGSNPLAVKRLLKDLKAFRKDGKKFGLDGGPRNDNLFVWDIKLIDIPASKLAKDLDAFAKKHNTDACINLEMMFPGDYPMSPPFVRVTTPRFKFLTGNCNFHNSVNKCINLEMMFPGDYPMSPPFVRVTTPRFKFLIGHVTIGGSICMEMLTKSGWTPTNDIENILVQIRCEILSDPNAQLDLNNANTAYTMSEAKAAFTRMVQRYGWDKS